MKKYKNRRKAVIALYILSVVLLSRLFAAERAATCDYVSINGDFQSYNVFRRILDGQAPYTEFSNYIGMAPVFVNLPFLIFENTFSNSLFITTFTSNIIFSICVFMIFYLVTEKLEISCFVSAVLAKVISTQILYRILGPKYGYIFTERFTGLFTPSNSMRGTRSFLPFLIVIIAAFAALLYRRRTGRKLDWIKALENPKTVGAAGFLLGFFVVWSNDYGVAAIASAFVIYVILQIFVYRLKFIRFAGRMGIMLAATALGAVFSMSFVTAGHPGSYISSMAQTAEYQFFYFNGTAGKAVIPYIFSTGALWLFTSVFLVFFAFALYRLVNGKADNSLLYLVFIALTVVAATFVYVAGGSGYNCREPLEVYSTLLVAAFIAKIIFCYFSKIGKLADDVSPVLLCAVAVFYVLQLISFTPQPQGTYIPAFDGSSTQTKALIEAAGIIGDNPVFSTYATGLETVTGQFQPTGYDYIIHALGKEVQEEYAQKFTDGEYPFAHTSSLPTESWISTQNWYFYRHLLPNYTRIFKTEYGWLWKKTESSYIDAQVDVKIEQINNSTVKIICTSDSTDEFVADIRINYSTGFNNIIDRLMALNRSAAVVSTGCVCGGEMSTLAIPDASQEYIPVLLNNGYGEAVVRAAFGDGIDLEVSAAQFIAAMPALNYKE